MAFSSGPPPRPLGIPKPPTVNRAAPVNQGPPVNHGPPVNQGPPINFQYLEPEPECISSWSTVFWIAVVLLLAVPILFNYDPLKGVLDINSMERETSSENALLAVEKDKSRQEREAMAQERELWEKARDARVPPGAFWDVVWPAWDCRAYGKREYWGSLRNIPNGWDAIDACMNMPVEIKGVKVRRPDRCARVFVFPEVQIHGYWMVDWDQPDCKPWYRDFEDKGCTGPNSGKRQIEAQIVGINNKGEQDWRRLCRTMPLVWDMRTYPSPIGCWDQFWGKKVAMWEVLDESCRTY